MTLTVRNPAVLHADYGQAKGAVYDGAALAGVALEPGLAAGVILHRLPVGLALWVLVRPRLGLRRMLWVAGALALGTVCGAFLGEVVLAGISGTALAVVQAFVRRYAEFVAIRQGPDDLDTAAV